MTRDVMDAILEYISVALAEDRIGSQIETGTGHFLINS